MFNNSGMAQFKEYFLGNGTPKATGRYAKMSSCQENITTWNVGFDTYHHTMFEMLGNWSFGDYFKRSHQLGLGTLTEVYKIQKRKPVRFCIRRNPPRTYHSIRKLGIFGNRRRPYYSWKQERQLLGNGRSRTLWTCSEIHVDIRSAEEKALVSGKSLVNNDHPK
jgi:alanyl-tRNA synthetase